MVCMYVQGRRTTNFGNELKEKVKESVHNCCVCVVLLAILPRAYQAGEGSERACNIRRWQNAERNCIILVPLEWLTSCLQRLSSMKT